MKDKYWFNHLLGGVLAFLFSFLTIVILQNLCYLFLACLTDLASDVQASLGKADTALQEITDVIYDIPAEFHAETSDHYFTFASGINASTILSELNAGKLPIVRNNYGSLKRRWYYSDYNNDGNDIYIQFFRETQFSREVMLYTESDAKAYIDSVSLSSFKRKPVTVWEVQDVSQGLLALLRSDQVQGHSVLNRCRHI